MKLRILSPVTIDGREYVAGQTISIPDTTGAQLVNEGDAEILADDAPGCFVEHAPA